MCIPVTINATIQLNCITQKLMTISSEIPLTVKQTKNKQTNTKNITTKLKQQNLKEVIKNKTQSYELAGLCCCYNLYMLKENFC